MRFPLHHVIDYAHTKPAEIDRALGQLLGKGPLPKDTDPDTEALLEGLFGEWLIFEYRQTNNQSFLVEFILKNPAGMSESQIGQFEQIAHTHFYTEFEIVTVKRGEYLDLEDIATGKIYRVYDKLGSTNSPDRGIFRSRMAHVDGVWYLVGANPLTFPLTYTPRMKKMLRKDFKGNPFTLKNSVELLLQQTKHPPQKPKILTQKELKQKRLDLEEAYTKTAIKYGATLTFKDLLKEIYHENRTNVLDFWKRLTKQGLPEKMLFENLQLLQDIWNHFPHKCLNGNSPAQMYTKLYQAKDRKRRI